MKETKTIRTMLTKFETIYIETYDLSIVAGNGSHLKRDESNKSLLGAIRTQNITMMIYPRTLAISDGRKPKPNLLSTITNPNQTMNIAMYVPIR